MHPGIVGAVLTPPLRLFLSAQPNTTANWSSRVQCVDCAAPRWHIRAYENIPDFDLATLYGRGDDDVDRHEHVQFILAAD
jgi:hypothetical protein